MHEIVIFPACKWKGTSSIYIINWWIELSNLASDVIQNLLFYLEAMLTLSWFEKANIITVALFYWNNILFLCSLLNVLQNLQRADQMESPQSNSILYAIFQVVPSVWNQNMLSVDQA